MESDGKFEQVLNLAEVDNNIQLGHILELHKEELQRVREESIDDVIGLIGSGELQRLAKEELERRKSLPTNQEGDN